MVSYHCTGTLDIKVCGESVIQLCSEMKLVLFPRFFVVGLYKMHDSLALHYWILGKNFVVLAEYSYITVWLRTT